KTGSNERVRIFTGGCARRSCISLDPIPSAASSSIRPGPLKRLRRRSGRALYPGWGADNPSGMETTAEADRLLDYPHPRERTSLLGHEAAEAQLLEAYRSGRLHHAWLIAGQRGSGKAAPAYRFARYVLRFPDGPPGEGSEHGLHVPSTDRVFRWVQAQAHPDLLVVRRDPHSK